MLKEDSAAGETVWSINRHARVGDRVLLYVCAPVSSIVATATIAEDPYLNEDVNSEWFGTWFAEMNQLNMLDSPLPRRFLIDTFPGWRYWTQPRNSVKVPTEHEGELSDYLAADAEIVAERKQHRGSRTHHIYATVDGHQWCYANKVIAWDYCRICLIIRRADRSNKPCKGPQRLGLRSTEAGEW